MLYKLLYQFLLLTYTSCKTVLGLHKTHRGGLERLVKRELWRQTGAFRTQVPLQGEKEGWLTFRVLLEGRNMVLKLGKEKQPRFTTVTAKEHPTSHKPWHALLHHSSWFSRSGKVLERLLYVTDCHSARPWTLHLHPLASRLASLPPSAATSDVSHPILPIHSQL